MAKRFIDTGFLDQKWIRKLSPERKIFVVYLMLKCDNGGIIDLDYEDASFWIGKKIESIDFLPDDYLISLNNGKYFMPKFIEWQYPNFPHSKVHQQEHAKRILVENELFDIETQTIILPNNCVNVRQSLRNNYVNANANANADVNVNVNVKKAQIFDFSFVNPGWLPIFTEWIDYKKSIKDNYTTQKSLEACYRNLQTLSQNDLIRAKKIIDQSMGNKWKGLFPLKESLQKQFNSDVKVSTKYIDEYESNRK